MEKVSLDDLLADDTGAVTPDDDPDDFGSNDDDGEMTDEDKKILASKKKLQEFLDEFDSEQKILKEVLKLEEDEAKQLEEELNLEAKFAKLEADAFGEQELLERLAEAKKQGLQNIEDKYNKIKAKKDEKDKAAQIKRDEKQHKIQIAARKKLKDDIINGAIALAGQETKIGQGLIAVKGIMAAKEMLIQLGVLKGKASVAVADATMATAVGAANTAKVGFPQNIPLLIGFAAQAVAIISAIKSATSAADTVKGFYDGGPTGNKAIYNDEFGAVTGVVHENEWVAPEWMNESPRYAPTINWLEKERKKEMGQFFEGGNTSEPSSTETTTETDTETADPNAMNFALMQVLEKFSAKLDEGIKAYTVRDYEDFIERKEIDQEHNEIFENTRHS